jgi:hypothetical protein
MGFIPIILTMGGAILLFFMAVHQSMIAKKNAILRLQAAIFDGFRVFGAHLSLEPAISPGVVDQIDEVFRTLNAKADAKNNAQFEAKVKIPYRDMKVTIDQYNRLVKKKPYSFVAKAMGHRAIGK